MPYAAATVRPGMVALNPQGDFDPCLAVIPYSHLYYRRYCATHGDASTDYAKVATLDALNFFKATEVHCIRAPEGALILWDSRTVHMAMPPMNVASMTDEELRNACDPAGCFTGTLRNGSQWSRSMHVGDGRILEWSDASKCYSLRHGHARHNDRDGGYSYQAAHHNRLNVYVSMAPKVKAFSKVHAQCKMKIFRDKATSKHDPLRPTRHMQLPMRASDKQKRIASIAHVDDKYRSVVERWCTLPPVPPTSLLDSDCDAFADAFHTMLAQAEPGSTICTYCGADAQQPHARACAVCGAELVDRSGTTEGAAQQAVVADAEADREARVGKRGHGAEAQKKRRKGDERC